MAFQLEQVVPWGRNFDEYSMMFQLDDSYRSKKIASFGDGPASFNCEASKMGYAVSSFDPLYQFSREQLQRRIEEVRKLVMQQLNENRDNYIWTKIKNPDELELLRMSAMRLFLEDYEQGKKEGRYIQHELPDRLPVSDDYFDVGLSSHFLLLYPDLGYEFHRKAISEMLRVCQEVRIFPILNLDAKETELASRVIAYFSQNNQTEIVETSYEFQKNGNQLLVIKKKGNVSPHENRRQPDVF